MIKEMAALRPDGRTTAESIDSKVTVVTGDREPPLPGERPKQSSAKAGKVL